MRTDFVHWYALADAATHAPHGSGVYQIKVPGQLIEYPAGKSAMVCYGSVPSLHDAVLEVSMAHPGDFMCRHQSSDTPDVLLEFVLSQFVRRFGVMPSWPSVDAS